MITRSAIQADLRCSRRGAVMMGLRNRNNDEIISLNGVERERENSSIVVYYIHTLININIIK